jgi:hypothetical protein
MVESRVNAGAVDCDETGEACAVVDASDAKRKKTSGINFEVWILNGFMWFRSPGCKQIKLSVQIVAGKTIAD